MFNILETISLCVALVVIGITDSIRKFFYPLPKVEVKKEPKKSWQERMCDDLGWEYKDSSGNY